ncbi:hypothetical protein [Hylemonella gracilis]|uniref:hypothetical protein n=1 Tax=Hylemonella gracilis TaxID=80880 RepID=UPI0012DE8E41|nr:hypothetical protein [Hylemonella gracilis]
MRNVNPTRGFYAYLESAGEVFNQKLFGNTLPAPLFTLRRHGHGLGYFSGRRWSAGSGKRVNEITLNPELFAQRPLLTLLLTIVQAQCDMWQHLHGEPSRPGYRNAQWTRKMIDIGIKPVSRDEQSQRQTGQGLDLIPQPGGKFLAACAEIAGDSGRPPFSERWLKSEITPERPLADLPKDISKLLSSPVGPAVIDPQLQEQMDLKEAKRKIKYTCLNCDVNVWGRPNLALICALCGEKLRPKQRARTKDC